MGYLIRVVIPASILCLTCIISSHTLNLPDLIAPHLNGNLSTYRDAMKWLYKYENLSCNPENVEKIIPEGKRKYSMFHKEFVEFEEQFVSHMKYAAKLEMIYAIYETCLMDADFLKRKVGSVLEYKRKYLKKCHPEILFKDENSDFMEASAQIIINELCSRITYQAIYNSDEECHKINRRDRIKECEIYIEKKNRRKYTNHMTGLLIYAQNDYFPSLTCSDIIKRRNCYVDAVKDCKFSTQYAAYNLWSLSKNDPLCTTELRESMGEETRS